MGVPAARAPRPRLRAFTLAEILVAISIVVILVSLVAVTAKSVFGNMKKQSAQAQIKVIADAIDRYSQAWPAWVDAQGNKTAAKGWPHWSGWALFPTGVNSLYANSTGLYFGTLTNFNDMFGPSDAVAADTNTNALGVNLWLKAASECLAYAITTPVNGAAPLRDSDSSMFMADANSNYPLAGSQTGSAHRRQLVDPWGKPYRYLWVVRDPLAYSGWRAITSADPNDPSNNSWGGLRYAPAVGYVLESAGPDGLFGDVWRRSLVATDPDVTNAADNLTVKP